MKRKNKFSVKKMNRTGQNPLGRWFWVGVVMLVVIFIVWVFIKILSET